MHMISYYKIVVVILGHAPSIIYLATQVKIVHIINETY